MLQNWMAEFEQILRELRLQVNSTRLDLSLTKGLPNWISSAFPSLKNGWDWYYLEIHFAVD